MKARLIGMYPNPNCINDNLLTLNHEVVFDKTGLSMNLADPRWQDEITNVGVTLSGFLGLIALLPIRLRSRHRRRHPGPGRSGCEGPLSTFSYSS